MIRHQTKKHRANITENYECNIKYHIEINHCRYRYFVNHCFCICIIRADGIGF